MTKDVSGRVPDGTGLSSPTEPQERLGPSGFDPSRMQRPDMTARLRAFESAVSNMPWVATRLAAGQQFNVYESADNDEYDEPCDWSYALCLGPITDHNFICPIVGQDRAQLVEAAMKVATEALREHGASDSDGEVEKIAAGLTKAQREGLLRAFPYADGDDRMAVAFSTGSCSSLMRDGLATAPSDTVWPWLTPLGLAVRNHLRTHKGETM